MSTNPINKELKVPVAGYIALIFAILYFSGIIPTIASKFEIEWLKAFDFGVLQGAFGTIADGKNFVGAGGPGAKGGFLFALSLFPSVMLALGSIELIEHYGGLKAAQKLLTPLLRPVMGLPGITGLAMISSLQSTDAGASMSKTLREDGMITEDERTIFGMFQFSGGAMITNFLSSGAAVTVLVAPKMGSIIIISFGVIFFFKVLGANMMRAYVKKFGEQG